MQSPHSTRPNLVNCQTIKSIPGTFMAVVPNAAQIRCSLCVICTQMALNCSRFQQLKKLAKHKQHWTGAETVTTVIPVIQNCFYSLASLGFSRLALATSKISSTGFVQWSSVNLSTQLHSGACGQQSRVLFSVPGRKCKCHHQIVHSTQHCCL